jgi:hypothetical protein
MNAANEEGVSGFSPAEKLAIRAVLDGASFGDAANSTGLPVDQVERICTRYHNGLAEAMKQGAIQFIANSLDDSPAPQPWDMMDDILAELGAPHPDDVPETEADRERMEAEKQQRHDSMPDGVQPVAINSPSRNMMDDILAELGLLEWDMYPKDEADRPRVEALIAKRKGEPSGAGTAKPKAPATPEAAAEQPNPAQPEDGITTERNPDGTFNVYDDGVLMESNVPEAELAAALAELRNPRTLARAEATKAIRAAKDTLAKPLPESKELELSKAMDGIVDELLTMPAEQRLPWIEQQIEDWLAPIREQEADWLASQLSEEPTTGIEQHDSTPDEGRHAAMDSPPRDMIDEILEEIGLPRWEDIPKTEADRIRMQAEKQQRQEALKRNPQT